MEFGEKLRQARTQAGLTQEDVVRQLGVSRQTVSNWENNRSYPDLASALKLSDLYGLSLDDMLKEDVELRLKLAQQQEDRKKCCSWVHDFGLVLLSIALLLGRYEQTEAGITLGVMGLVILAVSHGLLVFYFRENGKLLALRTLSVVLWFAGAFLRISSGHSSGTGDLLFLTGLVLLCYVNHQQQKIPGSSLPNTMFTGFVVAVVLLLSLTSWVTDSVEKGEYNDANPFIRGRDWRVAEVLHGDGAALPLVSLSGGHYIYLEYPKEDSKNLGGQFIHIPQPEGSALQGVWEMIPEENTDLRYRVTVEDDGSVMLACLEEEQLQWKYRLETAPAVGCTILDSLGVVTGAVDWYYDENFLDLEDPGGLPLRGKGTIKLSVPGDSETVTIYEEFRDGDAVEHQTMTLTKDRRGFVKFDRATRQNGQKQTGIYRIPYDGGEFVLVINFTP